MEAKKLRNLFLFVLCILEHISIQVSYWILNGCFISYESFEVKCSILISS